MTRMQLLRALDADDRALLDAAQALGLPEGGKVLPLRKKRLVRLLLVAALSALFAATAYAAGLFGLRELLTPGVNPREIINGAPGVQTESPVPTSGGYLPGYGLADSPEAKANGEYQSFFWEYQDRKGRECLEQGLDWRDWLPEDESWLEGDENLRQIHDIYLVYDREMAEQLRAIADKYGLVLHSQMVAPYDVEEFYALAGTEPFFLAGDRGNLAGKYVFEDGAYNAEGSVSLGGGEPLLFSFNCGLPGVLQPYAVYIEEPESYEQWTYVNFSGQTLTLALRNREGELGLEGLALAFYEENGHQIVLSASAAGTLSRETAQSLADCFDFSAACRGTPHVLPQEPAGPGGDLPIEDLARSEAYKGWEELEQWDRIQTGGESLRGVFPTGVEAVDQVAEALEESRGLRLPRDMTVLEEPTAEELRETLGFDPLRPGARVGRLTAYDNGAFQLCFTAGALELKLNYVPKDSFYPLFHRLVWLDLPSRSYETQGRALRVYADAGRPQARDYLLGQTETAYILLWTDSGANSAGDLEAGAELVDFAVLRKR